MTKGLASDCCSLQTNTVRAATIAHYYCADCNYSILIMCRVQQAADCNNISAHAASKLSHHIASLLCQADCLLTVCLFCTLQYSTLLSADHETAAVRILAGSWLQQQHAKLACGTEPLLKVTKQVLNWDEKQLENCSSWTANQESVKTKCGRWLDGSNPISPRPQLNTFSRDQFNISLSKKCSFEN